MFWEDNSDDSLLIDNGIECWYDLCGGLRGDNWVWYLFGFNGEERVLLLVGVGLVFGVWW